MSSEEEAVRAVRISPLAATIIAVLALLPVTAPAGYAGAQAPAASALVRVPFPDDDGSLTPYTFRLGYPLVTLIYDTIMWRDARGAPQPWLARSVGTSPDGRQITVRLAEGVRWHDGSPLTAADVAFTFEHMARHRHPRFTPQLRAVASVTVPDALTAVINLHYPSPGFLDQPLSDVPILPAHLWRALPPGRTAPGGLPMGSGPYRLTEHRPGEHYRLEANDAYFRGPPAVRAIEVPIITDVNGTLRALDDRAVDMVPVSLPPDFAAKVDDLGIRAEKGPLYLGTVLMFNLRHPPFHRAEVRRAIAEAIDIAHLARVAGDAVPADRGYLHPDSEWAGVDPLHRFDPEGARQRLAGLGLPPVEVLAPDNDPVRAETGRQVARALERMGVPAVSRAVPRRDLARAVGEDGAPPSFSLAIWDSPPLASYDPDSLRRVFGTDPADAPLNYSGYASPRFNELVDRIASTAEPMGRRAAVADTLRLLAAEVPVVPLFFAAGTFTYRPAVYDGWVFVKGSGILDKRSFVEPRLVRATNGETEGGTGNGLPVGYLSLALLAVALAMVVGALIGRRR